MTFLVVSSHSLSRSLFSSPENMEGMGYTSSLHRLVTLFIICLATTSVCSAGWVWGCLPNPLGMLLFVERLAEHPVAVYRQKSLVAVLR